jgi:fibronectin type 3 domain-containing protein
MKRAIKSTISLMLCFCVICSCFVTAFAADIATPTNLVVTAVADNGATLSWTGVDGVKGYVVARSTSPDGGWEDLGNTTSTTYTDSKASAGGTYYYAVRAYKLKTSWWFDTDNNREYGSYVVSEKVITDPSQVKGLMTIDVSASSITLAWDTIGGAKGYQIYMFDEATNKYKKIATTSKQTYTVRNLKDRTTYKFKVRSYHKVKGVTYGSFSDEFSVTTALPDVTNFRVTKSTSDSYTIAWDANNEVSGFELQKYSDYDGEWKAVKFNGSVLTKETSYSVTGLPKDEGGYAEYRIRTYVDSGKSKTYGDWSSSLIGGTRPKAPLNIKIAANTDNGLSITWNYRKGAAGYEVYCKDNKGVWGSIGTTTTNHFSHKNLTEEKVYEYQVRAYVGDGKDKFYGEFGETVSAKYVPIEKPEEIYPEEWAKLGVFGYLYDYNEKCFYTADDTWQRNFGYSEIYDNGASLIVIVIETARIKFDYDNRNWMFQLWKGQYGWVLYGAEIGIYNKEKNRPVEHYTCSNDEDMIQMQMDLYENVGGTWQKSFSRPYERQWWHTGFVWGNMIGRNKDLQMRARLTMRDFDMLDAVVKGFKEAGFKEVKTDLNSLLGIFSKEGKNDYKDAFFVKDLDIYFYWTELFH